ncbi:MAG: electron transport complex subunit RsxE [Bacillota bacterium]|jgi:electron transport complex protein RnfE
MKKINILTNGILRENPVLIMLLGICPALAVTSTAINGLGMGITTLAVLVCSNLVISLVKNVIPDTIRIPCYVVIIAGFVSVVSLLLKAYLPELDKALGLFIPLIAVNCVVISRAEIFAGKNNPFNSILDGLGFGIGFTLALFLIGSIREILGNGSWFGLNFIDKIPYAEPISIFMLAPGAFFVFGCLVALINHLSKGKAAKRNDFGCDSCSSAETCQNEGSCIK